MTTSIPVSVSQKRYLPIKTRELNLELPFLCQIDKKIHSALELAYWYDRCDIYVCGGYFAAFVTVVGLTACHHCHGGF